MDLQPYILNGFGTPPASVKTIHLDYSFHLNSDIWRTTCMYLPVVWMSEPLIYIVTGDPGLIHLSACRSIVLFQ